jgi:hypothetical protein
LQPCGPVARTLDREPCGGQASREEVEDALLILDYQYSHLQAA